MKTSRQTFLRAINDLLDIEGEKYTNHPNDPGGPTKWGISEVYWPSMAPVKNLTRIQAVEFYEREFWRNLVLLEDEDISTKVFYMAVNFGFSFTIRQLQEACNELSAGKRGLRPINVDGKLGPNTAARANWATYHWQDGGERLYGAIIAEQFDHYKTRPHRADFYPGWMHRVLALLPDNFRR
jgi:lysozyme family protein